MAQGLRGSSATSISKGEAMNPRMKVLAALVLLTALAGCAQLGMAPASGVSTSEPSSYEPPADG